MRNKPVYFIILFLVSITVLWFICSAVAKKNAAKEHFPSNGADETITPTPIQTPAAQEPLYNYYTVTESKDNFTISMHVLEVDLSNPHVLVRPVTSHSTLFGYALLSEMHEKWGAQASVNGGFSHINGLPGGMYAAYGELFTTATGQYPVLFLKDGKAFFEDAETPVYLQGKMDDEGNTIRLGSLYYNQYPKGEGLFVFTPSYGSENRIDKPHLNAVISNGEVRGLATSYGSFEIPKDGFLVSAIGDYAAKRLESSVKPGMKLEIVYETLTKIGDKVEYDWAFECGSRIIKDGEIVVPDSDTWVGTLNSRAPRTAVGIKDDGTLVFIAVDGRQKSLSDGLTGRELAQRLLTLGIKDSAFLDGGASTEMIIEGKIVNSPSAGRERMISSCFIIKRSED